MIDEKDKVDILGQLYKSHVLFSPYKKLSITYHLPGNIFSRMWFFISLIITGKGNL